MNLQFFRGEGEQQVPPLRFAPVGMTNLMILSVNFEEDLIR